MRNYLMSFNSEIRFPIKTTVAVHLLLHLLSPTPMLFDLLWRFLEFDVRWVAVVLLLGIQIDFVLVFHWHINVQNIRIIMQIGIIKNVMSRHTVAPVRIARSFSFEAGSSYLGCVRRAVLWRLISQILISRLKHSWLISSTLVILPKHRESFLMICGLISILNRYFSFWSHL